MRRARCAGARRIEVETGYRLAEGESRVETGRRKYASPYEIGQALLYRAEVHAGYRPSAWFDTRVLQVLAW
jgi:hypothetical protein